MQLKIKTISGREKEIEISLEKTVEDLKKEIQKSEMIPPQQQKLIFNGAIFTNEQKKLSEYNLQSGNVIHMVLALRGG